MPDSTVVSRLLRAWREGDASARDQLLSHVYDELHRLAEGGLLEKYSFNAHNLGNGEVGGRFNVRDIFADGTATDLAKGSVTCFTVEAGGRRARMGGTVESAANPAFVGTDAAWTVVDNGEGSNDPEDQGTDLRWGLAPGTAAFHCAVGVPDGAFGTFGESGRGNVQVKP